MSSRAEQSPPVSVVAAVSIGSKGTADLTATLGAVRDQVYGVRRVVLVGSDAARKDADEAGVDWIPSMAKLLETLEDDVSHIWLLHVGAVPRPDAVGALILEAERTDAGVAGSKLLDRDEPHRLISVGLATDVFDAPYTGLEPDEQDAGQYDVVRDVAAVNGASMLVRKDLARGIGGSDPKMAPLAASIDFSQRARLRGARVVVVPSSEVLYDTQQPRGIRWREDASQIRAMSKVYSVLTLAWAVPLSFLAGLAEAIVAPFVGRWTLFAWVRAWLWNLFRLPSTFSSRRQARAGRVADDAELFRYQVRGSVRLRTVATALAARLRSRIGTDSDFSITDLGRDLRQPAFVTAAIAAVFIFLATRQIWSSGLPVVRYSLPIPESGWDTLAAYAGGWNPAELGSVEPLRPFLAVVGLLQTVFFDRTGLTTTVLIAGSFAAGVWGMNRFLRVLGIEVIAGVAAGAVLMAGPATQTIAHDTGLPTLVALGVVPWVCYVCLSSWPERWPARVGRLLAAGWLTATVAMLSPVTALIPILVLAVWALLNFRQRAAWRSLAVAAIGAGLSVPVLLPWIAAADLSGYLSDGEAYWLPSVLVVVIVAIAAVAALVAAPVRLATVAGWGAITASGGAVLARSGDLGSGREIEHLGLAFVAVGTAIVVAATLDGLRRVDEIVGWRRAVVAAGSVAAVFVVATTLLVVVPGRAGLPGDELTSRMGFTALADGDPSASRILLVGPPEVMPGDARSVRGAAYRVVSAPLPDLTEAWLPAFGPADSALASELGAMVDGETFRAGEALEPFGIRWVISLGDTPLEGVFEGQLDLVPLGASRGIALTNEMTEPVRASTVAGGVAWARPSIWYEGRSTPARVYLAEAAHQRWGEDWIQSSWANEVSGFGGQIRFRALENRRLQALIAGGLFLVLLTGSIGLRRWRK
jgi:GT2 family glycosyltransferase